MNGSAFFGLVQSGVGQVPRPDKGLLRVFAMTNILIDSHSDIDLADENRAARLVPVSTPGTGRP